jgi:hypothetical protein
VLFAVRKDSVLEAFDHYARNKGYDMLLADQNRSLYQQIQKLQKTVEQKKRWRSTRKIIHFASGFRKYQKLSRATFAVATTDRASERKCLSQTLRHVSNMSRP